ncbi:MAG: hypothetical protein QM692_08115 [Thermomicrobiales bacterium]
MTVSEILRAVQTLRERITRLELFTPAERARCVQLIDEMEAAAQRLAMDLAAEPPPTSER